MNNENKPLMYPDRVLSLVVLVLAVLMIMGIASLQYFQDKMSRSSANIIRSSDEAVNQIRASIPQTENPGEKDASDLDVKDKE